MKTWRNEKFSKGIKYPKSKRMKGIYKSPSDISKKITIQKNRQQKTIKNIKDEIKKLNQFYISLDGLQSLSDSSIKDIHDRREKAILELIRLTGDLSIIAREIRNLQKKYRKLLKL